MTATTLKAPVAGTIETILKKWGKETCIQDFTLPDGKKIDFLFYRAAATPSIVFPITAQGEIVALRQFRFGANGFVIEIPGGLPEANEKPEDGIRRELLEETGYRAREIITLGPPTWFDPASVRVPYIPVAALGCERVGEPHLDATEIAEVLTFPIADWMAMIARGEVDDSKTLAVTLLAVLRFRLLDQEHAVI